ncbi:alpha/beta-hydrolase [Clavulina sp. PMI_390]|nr:alpha/beta-hydrolase [Clavulina sp. PMI_390]
MDPQDPNSFHSRTERLSTGRTYHFIDEKPAGYTKETPTILALHGFPDRWYGWRNQIGPWVRRGWRVIVPDALGYGGTDKPKDISAYSLRLICNDFAALLDHEGLSQVVVVGHDWGAATAWRFALWHPERVRIIACLSIPFYPPAPSYVPPPLMAKRVPLLGYQLFLGEERSTPIIQNKATQFVDLMFRGGGAATQWASTGQMEKALQGELKAEGKQDLLTQAEFDFYVSSFSSDLYGPLSWYKTAKIRYEEEKAAKLLSFLPASLPALFIRGTEDPSSPPMHAKRAKNFVPSLESYDLAGAGHWLMVERKDEITTVVGDWIEEKLKEKPSSKL